MIRPSLRLIASLLLLAACNGDPGGQGNHHAAPGPAARFFLPTGEATNTTAPAVATDARGNIHTVYPRYAGGDAFYASGGPDCQGDQDMTPVVLPTEGTVGAAMLALDPQGRPRVLLSTSSRVYYAACDEGCTDQANWQMAVVLEHDGNKDVSGAGFALDPEGRPRFLLHTRVTYLGIGQKAPRTEYVVGDGDLFSPAGWKAYTVSDQLWYRSELRFDARGRPHVATSIDSFQRDDGSSTTLGAYLTCDGDCTTPEGWHGVGLEESYASETEAIAVKPSIALSLTSQGAPRIAQLAKSATVKKGIVYFACDADCTNAEAWTGSLISSHDRIDDGLDLGLDANDLPRFVYTLDYNIGLASCDDARCESAEANWNLLVVEKGSDIPTDDIFLYENCTVGAWFLHTPSLALTVDGKPRVGYQIRDVSGGWSNPDPTKPGCPVGTDMTLSRLAVLPSARP